MNRFSDCFGFLGVRSQLLHGFKHPYKKNSDRLFFMFSQQEDTEFSWVTLSHFHNFQILALRILFPHAPWNLWVRLFSFPGSTPSCGVFSFQDERVQIITHVLEKKHATHRGRPRAAKRTHPITPEVTKRLKHAAWNFGCCFRPFLSAIKGSGHYWYLLKIVISIKPYLVKSNGERLVV